MRKTLSALCMAAAVMTATAAAAVTYDPLISKPTNVTPVTVSSELLFGSGNANGSFTVATNGNIEVGLRAKLRFDSSGQPQNKTSFNGVDTYTFDPADGNEPAGLAIWNFEYSVFTGLGGSTNTLGDYFLTLDLVDPDANSFSFGANGAGFGVAVVGLGGFANTNTVQDSQNPGFSIFSAVDGTLLGTYVATLTVSNCSGLLCNRGADIVSTKININTVPVPAALPLLASGLLGLILLGRRRSVA